MRIAIVFLLLISTASFANVDYKITEVATGLNRPWSLAFLPNGDYLISLRGGELRTIGSDGVTSEPIANTPIASLRGRGGYFDVLLDPSFPTNKIIYLAIADGEPESNATSIYKARLGGGELENVAPLFIGKDKKEISKHYGGRMIIANDRTLYLTIGDGFSFREEAQNALSHLGTVIRINLDGSLPDDNPFINGEGGDPYVQSIGHRNPQGLAYDSENDIVYLLDHGPKGGDEVNLIKAGANYGWPAATFGVNYSGAQVTPHTSLPGMEDSLIHWTPSIAPSGMAFYNHDLFPEWKGNLFVGALKDRDVRRLQIQNGKIAKEEVLFEEIGERIRDVRVGPNGHLYLLTDSKNGKLLRISPE